MFALIEGIAVRKVAVTAVSLSVAWAMAHVSGHWGITVDPQALTAALFTGLEYARQLIAVKYPDLAPWLH